MTISEAIRMHNITKYFGDFCALDNVDFAVERGSIHAILGENGAGKTTLMNILYGLHSRDGGDIIVDGAKVDFKSPRDAIDAGIGMVHQHFKLVDTYTVLQNIVLGYEDTRFLGILDYKRSRSRVEELIHEYNFSIDLDAKVSEITVGMQQRVEIVKALHRGANTLILDEPTAVLTPQEIEDLIGSIKCMAQEGKTIIIITHKLTEIMECAHRCLVLRRGKTITDIEVEGCTANRLASLMVGREVSFTIDKIQEPGKELLFQIRNLVVENNQGIKKLNDLSLDVCRSEIVGIAGVDGNGQFELYEAIASLARVKSGTITIDGKEVQNTSPKVVQESGIGIIPEDRQKDGLILDFTVAENFILDNLRTPPFSKRGLIQSEIMRTRAQALVDEYDIRPKECVDLSAGSLSGGNQQKAIIARKIGDDPKLLVAIQPTRGIDVGAIEYVHQVLIEQRNRGMGILLISFELDEIFKMADRIAVIYDGRIVDIIKGKEANQNRVGLLMAGGN